MSSAFNIAQLPFSQLVPCQSLHRRRCRFLHRCVCTVPFTHESSPSLIYFISPDMTSLPLTSLPPCWVICTVLQQVHHSTLHKVLVSRSQLLLEPSLVNYSSVGWLMLSVVKGCVCIFSPLSLYSSYFTYRRYRAHDYHCCYFWPSCLRKW